MLGPGYYRLACGRDGDFPSAPVIQAADHKARVWLGPSVALVIGLPILLWGVLTPSAPELAWFVPVCDVLAVVGMLIVLLMAMNTGHAVDIGSRPGRPTTHPDLIYLG